MFPQGRDSAAQGLRDDDVALGLAAAQANGARAFDLARVHRQYAGTNDVGVVDGEMQAQADDPGHQCRDIDPHLHQAVVDEVQL